MIWKIAPIICLVAGIFIGMQLTPESSGDLTQNIQSQSPEPPKKKRVNKKKEPEMKQDNEPVEVKGILGLEGIYAQVKEPLLLNKEIPAVQKAVMLHDIETREAYQRVIEDFDAQMEVELSIQAPYSRRLLEYHLQKEPENVIARALLVKYLVLASYRGSGIFDETDLKRAVVEAKRVAQVSSIESRAEIERLSIELAGFLETCPSAYAKELRDFLGRSAAHR